MRPLMLSALLALSAFLLPAEEDWSQETVTYPVGFRAFRERRRKELLKGRRNWEEKRLKEYRKEAEKWRKGERSSPPDPGALGRVAAIVEHIHRLSDPDPEVRQTSAQILGQMDAFEAIPNLIELLNDENVYVKIYAHGALNKLTGKNFGYKNYAEWKAWWSKRPDVREKDFLQHQRDMQKIRAYPSNTAGLIALAAGDFVRAAKMFLDAIDCDPDIPDYWNNFGLALMELARQDRSLYSVAMECFMEAIDIDPSLPQPYMNIGQCFSHLGKKEQAYHWFRMSVQRDEKGILWEHCWQLGALLLKDGDDPLAMEYLRFAQQKAEMNRIRDRRIYRSLALGYVALGEEEKALEALRIARSCPTEQP